MCRRAARTVRHRHPGRLRPPGRCRRPRSRSSEPRWRWRAGSRPCAGPAVAGRNSPSRGRARPAPVRPPAPADGGVRVPRACAQPADLPCSSRVPAAVPGRRCVFRSRCLAAARRCPLRLGPPQPAPSRVRPPSWRAGPRWRTRARPMIGTRQPPLAGCWKEERARSRARSAGGEPHLSRTDPRQPDWRGVTGSSQGGHGLLTSARGDAGNHSLRRRAPWPDQPR